MSTIVKVPLGRIATSDWSVCGVQLHIAKLFNSKNGFIKGFMYFRVFGVRFPVRHRWAERLYIAYERRNEWVKEVGND